MYMHSTVRCTLQGGGYTVHTCIYTHTHTHTHTHFSLSLPDPNSVLQLLESALTMDKIGSLLSKHHRQDMNKVEELANWKVPTVIQ